MNMDVFHKVDASFQSKRLDYFVCYGGEKEK